MIILSAVLREFGDWARGGVGEGELEVFGIRCAGE
jgi:hypothetical protein